MSRPEPLAAAPSPTVRVSVSYDGDLGAGAETLLALLRQSVKAGEAEPRDDEDDDAAGAA